jgi:hypothetical protein
MTHFAIGFDCTVRDRAVDALFEACLFGRCTPRRRYFRNGSSDCCACRRGCLHLLGRALPNRALYHSNRSQSDEPDATPRSRLTATRLSKWGAIAISVGSIALFGALLKFAPSLDVGVALAIVVISPWVTVDSYQVRLRAYQTRIALHPIALFNAMMFLWPIIFPWYLIVCSKIGDGTLPKKPNRGDSTD